VDEPIGTDAAHAACKSVHEDTAEAAARCVICTVRKLDGAHAALVREREAHARTQAWLDTFQGTAAASDVRVMQLRSAMQRAVAVARSGLGAHATAIRDMLTRALTADLDLARRNGQDPAP
jgi:hypothetical protein